MSWLSSLFSGDKGVNNAASSLMGTGAAATAQGMGDIGSASTFWNNILQGNAAKSLAPQIGSIRKQGQQKIQTLSQFGNRGGGTNAAAASVGDTTNANINDLIASLTGSAASNLGNLGSNLLNTGVSATQSGAQLKMQNKSLFSDLLNQAASGAGSALTKWAMS
jgi:uncharacterized protein YejL (UPF0352 family)